MEPGFIHLHLHTEYSLVDGLLRVPSLMKRVGDLGMPAVAMTDQGNLFAMVRFYQAAQAAGIQPIIGVDTWVMEDDETPPSRLVLLCQNDQGYRHLTVLVSRAYQEGQQRGVPRMHKSWFQGHTDGLIALSGGREGDVGRALLSGQPDRAQAMLAEWQALFGDRYYLELQRCGRSGDEEHVRAAVQLAVDTGTPVVATNDVRFLFPDDFEAHEARVCIHQGRVLDDPARPREYSREQYLKSPEQMAELFADLPEALENSVEIARRCSLTQEFGRNYLPDYPVPEGRDIDTHLQEESRAGLEARIAADAELARQIAEDPAVRQVYDDRLATELKVIIDMGFPGYFLIVADFIRWAKQNGVPVGPGRGSGAGSLVAYVLGITDIDPIRYDLLFERFLNPERVSMPDFDVDFCMEGRDRVIEYVAERYGREKVSQIITYGTMAAKAVVRDVGRVLGHPYGFVDQVAKLIPFELGMTLDKALEQSEELRTRYDQDEEVRVLIDLARSLEGLVRNAGKHAGGVVIAPSQLTDFTPLYCEEGSAGVVTQYDKDDVESVGLVKFDFLGLRTLTIIDWALRTLNAQREADGAPPVDINAIPMDDPAAFALLQRCATTAVFQLESRGMKELIKRLKPDNFEDIIALVALYRPGPLQSGMVDDFVDRKHGRARVEYPHPDLTPILRPTYGVILYQEQVMQIAQVLAGYSLGGADLLRRAMGKKKPEEMAKQREIFLAGAQQREVNPDTAAYIFDLMEKFAGYGFNKSHSAAYALVSYQTAWLKAHYPAAFMAAVLSSDMDHTDKVVGLIEECRRLDLSVCPPDVNRSQYRFTVSGDDTVIYGLGAIKGVGQSAIETLIREREANGAYADLFELCRRVDLRRVNRRVLEALIRAGALDSMNANRALLIAQLPDALKSAEQHERDTAMGQVDLFGAAPEAVPVTEAVSVAPWSDEERLKGEKETLGLYLTGHPILRYEAELRTLTSGPLEEFIAGEGAPEWEAGRGRAAERKVRLAGLVAGVRVAKTRRGRMAFVTLDDGTGRLDVVVFPEDFQRHREKLGQERVMVVEGTLSVDEYSGGFRMSAERIVTMEEARAALAESLEVRLSHAEMRRDGFIDALRTALAPHVPGPCSIQLDYTAPTARAGIMLGPDWRVRPSDACLDALRALSGPDAVQVRYRRGWLPAETAPEPALADIE